MHDREAVTCAEVFAIDLVHQIPFVQDREVEPAARRPVCANDAHAVGVFGVAASLLDEPADRDTGDLGLADSAAADRIQLAHHLRGLRDHHASGFSFGHQLGQLLRVGRVHVPVDRELPLVEHALGQVDVKPVRPACVTHMVVIAVNEVVAVQLVLRLHLVLGGCELALHVFNLVDALQRLMLHVVPQLHAVAIRSRVVTRLTRAVRALGELVPAALVVVDGMYETAEIVAVVTMARDALVHVAVRLERFVVDRGMLVLHVLDHRIHISMARIAPSVVRVEVVRVVRNGPALLHPMGALVLGRGTLNQLPIRISDDLGRVLLGDLVPLVVILDDILFAGILNIAVRLPSAHYFVCSRRRIGRKRRTDHATSCSHRQHPRHSKRGLQSHVSHDLSSILSCRACGSSALSLAPPSNLEQARTPHTRKMVEARDVHRHRRIRVNMTKGSNGYPPVWLIEARRVFAYRENRI